MTRPFNRRPPRCLWAGHQQTAISREVTKAFTTNVKRLKSTLNVTPCCTLRPHYRGASSTGASIYNLYHHLQPLFLSRMIDKTSFPLSKLACYRPSSAASTSHDVCVCVYNIQVNPVCNILCLSSRRIGFPTTRWYPSHDQVAPDYTTCHAIAAER